MIHYQITLLLKWFDPVHVNLSVCSVKLFSWMTITHIKLEEPKWLSGGSHTSVFNGGPLGSHFGSPEIRKHVYMCLFWIYQLLKMALSGEPKWIQLVRKGLKCPNGSLGSSKSSSSFMCEVLTSRPKLWTL